jgi:lysyl-tRNA synthetase class 2
MSARHSPEFTMLEWSMSYSNYCDSATLVEQMVSHLAMTVIGTMKVTFRGTTINLETPWRRISLRDAIKERTGLDIFDASEELIAQVPANGSDRGSWSDAVHHLYATEVEPHLSQPSIIYDFPLDTHPCAKRHPTAARFAQCFDVVLGGLEIASGGTEINDPDEQRRRFVEQNEVVNDSRELHLSDRDYVAALGYGAPPSSGAGVGIDRLLMVLLGVDSISEVTLFSPLG